MVRGEKGRWRKRALRRAGSRSCGTASRSSDGDAALWISGRDPRTHWVYTAKPRYRTPDMPCEIDSLAGDRAEIAFAEPQWALTPGRAWLSMSRRYVWAAA